MGQTPVFLYGPLQDDLLRASVFGGSVASEITYVPDHIVAATADRSRPSLVRHSGGRAEGLLVALDDNALARLDFYESLFCGTRVTIDLDGLAVQVYSSAPEPVVPLQRWSFTHWQEHDASVARCAALEIFALSVVYGPEALRVRYPMLLAHHASQLRAAQEPLAQSIRRSMAAGDVVSRQTTQPYAYFFGVQVDDLQFRRFDGSLSAVVRRAGFVMADAVTVLPYDPVRDCVMVIEQFRYGLFMRGAQNCWVLEPIAGRIDGGEAPQTAALREMVEEARLDLTADNLVAIGGSYPSPGAISEYLYHYIAVCDLPQSRTGVAGLASEAEDIRSHILPFDRAMDLITTGEAQNGPLIQSLYWLALNRDRLRADVKG
jgi:ADP-ribose pyrophosphatase